MNLNYKKLGSGEPLIILHGLFGSLDNWMTLAKKWGDQFEVFLVDARNHGQSPHAEAFNYDIMADDLYEFLIQHQIVNPTILGHSMGGKTAMQFAMNYPTQLEKLIIVDIAPKAYPVHHQTILAGMLSLDFDKIKSRTEADQQLSQYIPELSVRQFLLKNLYWAGKEKLAFRFNLPAINKNIEIVGQGLENIHEFTKPTLFIRAEKSNYINPKDFDYIHQIFTSSKIETLACGHWIHAEKPLELFNLVANF